MLKLGRGAMQPECSASAPVRRRLPSALHAHAQPGAVGSGGRSRSSRSGRTSTGRVDGPARQAVLREIFALLRPQRAGGRHPNMLLRESFGSFDQPFDPGCVMAYGCPGMGAGPQMTDDSLEAPRLGVRRGAGRAAAGRGTPRRRGLRSLRSFSHQEEAFPAHSCLTGAPRHGG
jgi:hypothetical protein